MNGCPYFECRTSAGCGHRGPRGEFCYFPNQPDHEAIVRQGTLEQRVARLERLVAHLCPDSRAPLNPNP